MLQQLRFEPELKRRAILPVDLSPTLGDLTTTDSLLDCIEVQSVRYSFSVFGSG